MCGPVRANLSGLVASALARRQGAARLSVPLVIGPSATAAGRVLNPIVGCASKATISSNANFARTPPIGWTKYSIMPLVSGWFGSKRTNSPSQTTSMPAFS